jgi:hypothetical protein
VPSLQRAALAASLFAVPARAHCTHIHRGCD